MEYNPAYVYSYFDIHFERHYLKTTIMKVNASILYYLRKAYICIRIDVYIYTTFLNNQVTLRMDLKQIKKEIKEIIEIDCPICYEQYDHQEFAPMIICSAQHSICRKCIQVTFSMLELDEEANCPICTQPYLEEEYSRFRIMDQVIEVTKLAEKFQELKNEQIVSLQKQKQQLAVQLDKHLKFGDECKKLKKQIQKMKREKLKTQFKKTLKTQLQESLNKLNKVSKTDRTKKSYFLNSKDGAVKSIQSNFFLAPKDIEPIPTKTKYKLKPDEAKRCQTRQMLPYFINKKCISTAQLKELQKKEKSKTLLTNREVWIKMLQVYDLSQAQAIDLQGLKFNQEHFIQLSPNKHTLFRLQSINLSRNRLQKMPQFMLELFNLKVINLNQNHIAYLHPDINLLVKLQRLFLWNNKLFDLPSTISELNNLTELQISNNVFEYLPSCLLLNIRLKKVNLFGNPIKVNEENRILFSNYLQKKIVLDIN